VAERSASASLPCRTSHHGDSAANIMAISSGIGQVPVALLSAGISVY
jgi:hypothetical protein